MLPGKLLAAALSLLMATDVAGQELGAKWQALPTGPASPTGRHEDIFFINENTGWVVNLSGHVYRTDDSGDTWETLYHDSGYQFRSVTFANESRGWIGTLQQDKVLLETYDGGSTWTNLTNRLKTPPGALCAIQALSDQTVYAVGAFFGGPWFVKTTNGGDSWASSLIGTDARTLVDLYFKNENEGIAVGGTANATDLLHGDAVVLRTTDGGSHWTTVHRTDHGSGVEGEWGWKISFPTEQVGYVSIEYTGNNTQQTAKYLKTVDGGLTWTEHFIPVSKQVSGLQGIGFITEDLGWASGRGKSSITRDGGVTWEPMLQYDPTAHPDGEIDGSTNRIFLVNNSLAFAVGKYTYRFDTSVQTAIESNAPSEQPRLFIMDQNYPNPFTSLTTIAYTLFKSTNVRITVHDILGRRVRLLVDAVQTPGPHRITWDGTDDRRNPVTTGSYLYLLDIGDQIEMKQAVVLRD